MDQSDKAALEQQLKTLRAQIDRFDNDIHQLIINRGEVVAQIGAAKAKYQAAHGDGAAIDKNSTRLPIRLDREAQMFKRLLANHKGSFPVKALVRIWHELIGAYSQVQSEFSIVVASEDGPNGLWDLAKDQFGVVAKMVATDSPQTALAMVNTGEHDLAVIPTKNEGKARPWWADASVRGHAKIIARLPYIDIDGPQSEKAGGQKIGGQKTGDAPITAYAPVTAFVLAQIDPVPTGNDVSLFAVNRLNDKQGQLVIIDQLDDDLFLIEEAGFKSQPSVINPAECDWVYLGSYGVF